jgi:hypothetical protein
MVPFGIGIVSFGNDMVPFGNDIDSFGNDIVSFRIGMVVCIKIATWRLKQAEKPGFEAKT